MTAVDIGAKTPAGAQRKADAVKLALETQLAELELLLGSLPELETTAKDNLVAAINEIKQLLATHLADLASQEVGKGADLIGLPDPNNIFTSTNVGGAMQELFTNVSDGKQTVGTAITDVDPNVLVPTEPTFNDLAIAIGQISTGVLDGLIAGESGSIYIDNTLSNTEKRYMTKVKEVVMNVGGSVRVSVSFRNLNANYSARAQLYINDLAVGEIYSRLGGSELTFTNDVTFTAGDKIQVYALTVDGNGSAHVTKLSVNIDMSSIAEKNSIP
ncbi:hypothetical protein QT711_07205 [Sporosarcina saromensis]|uniref:Uncharacterized protein n=1 Tax=Sporosarcina saromensis TaxID=359365 RepID=A0ABU4G7L3_9BACL|nr:hypothetical protein [Sporosarcina saromensis]MDW0112968.1 hypothetical protein [Sporosarcina saromensis]